MIFDTHAHYDDEQFDTDRDELLSSMAAGGVGTIVDAAATVESWDKIVELAEKYSFIYGSVGVHPDEVGALNEENFARMRELLKKEKIVAVGEIGLDYYWDKEGHDLQKHWFIRQLDLAREMNKPVMIHSREAAADTMEIMKEHGALNALMSGSGPTVFGLFEDEKTAKRAYRAVKESGLAKQLYLTTIYNNRK
jgi:TatD DNase family protein